jgi:regulation of enolase protein 1 (concanavalin A-like superfamily)
MDWTWINPPSEWSGDAHALELVTNARTDFWQETFYGFRRNTGHAFLAPVAGDFTLSARVTGAYEALYDQAGLMLYRDERNWVKTGIEFTDDLMHLSVVATREVSDWSVIPLPAAKPTDELLVRLTRHGDAVRIQYRIGTMAAWQMARLAPFSAADAQAGIMACSPERAGFRARFRDVVIGPPIARQLHAG